MEERKVKLLTDEEFIRLPLVLTRREMFKNMVMKAIESRRYTFTNSIFIQGNPGTGKTTIVLEFLEELLKNKVIDNYYRCTGHITPTSLYEFLKPKEQGENVVHMFDDVDCLYNQGCLEILKSALETRSNKADNRFVSYMARGIINSYKYTGFVILITNDKLAYPTEHLRAVLDRVHLMTVDLQYDEFVIFNTYLVEEYLNSNEDGLSQETIRMVRDFYIDKVRSWFEAQAFMKANINFSIRLIKKFIDLIIMFGKGWEYYSIDYKKLDSVMVK